MSLIKKVLREPFLTSVTKLRQIRGRSDLLNLRPQSPFPKSLSSKWRMRKCTRLLLSLHLDVFSYFKHTKHRQILVFIRGRPRVRYQPPIYSRRSASAACRERGVSRYRPQARGRPLVASLRSENLQKSKNFISCTQKSAKF